MATLDEHAAEQSAYWNSVAVGLGWTRAELEAAKHAVTEVDELTLEYRVLTEGETVPTCDLCGGSSAPIVRGRHLNPDKFCEPTTRPQEN